MTTPKLHEDDRGIGQIGTRLLTATEKNTESWIGTKNTERWVGTKNTES
jgi:hypothetical protein